MKKNVQNYSNYKISLSLLWDENKFLDSSESSCEGRKKLLEAVGDEVDDDDGSNDDGEKMSDSKLSAFWFSIDNKLSTSMFFSTGVADLFSLDMGSSNSNSLKMLKCFLSCKKIKIILFDFTYVSSLFSWSWWAIIDESGFKSDSSLTTQKS